MIDKKNVGVTYGSSEGDGAKSRAIKNTSGFLELECSFSTLALLYYARASILVFVHEILILIVIVLFLFLETSVTQEVGRTTRFVQRAPDVRDLTPAKEHRLLLTLDMESGA
jgi:hypothetical protein